MKRRESLAASCAGADGAIFAIRKDLFRPLRADDINDLVIPLNVLKAGKRVVMDPDLFCYEQAAEGAYGEYRRQVRITARTLKALRRHMECMNPFRFGLFSFFLISHKGMRLMFPFFMLGAAAVCALSYRGPGFFKGFLAAGALAVGRGRLRPAAEIAKSRHRHHFHLSAYGLCPPRRLDSHGPGGIGRYMAAETLKANKRSDKTAKDAEGG